VQTPISGYNDAQTSARKHITVPMPDSAPSTRFEDTRLLDHLCQGALTLLPCDLAWLLMVEQGALRGRAIACVKGESAGLVFLRLVANGALEQPTISLNENHPLVVLARSGERRINVAAESFREMPEGALLHRALSQIRLSHAHILPLTREGEGLLGVLMLATATPYPTYDPRAGSILQTITQQAVETLDHVRLMRDLAQREVEMRTEQAFRKMVMDSMGDSMIIIDDEAQIIYMNNRLLAVTGYTRRELQGVSVGVIFIPEGRPRLVENLKHGGRGTVHFIQNMLTKGGRVIPVQLARSTAPVANGGVNTILVLTDLTEQKARETALERQSERLRALNKGGQLLAGALSLDEIADHLLEIAPFVVECSDVALFMPGVGDDNDVFTVVAAQGGQAESIIGKTVRIGDGIAGRVASERRPLVISKIDAGETFVRAGNSIMAVPLVTGDQVVGVLEVISKSEGTFSQDDIETLENLGSAAAVAIDKVRLLNETQRRVSELQTILEASGAVSSTLELDGVLERITLDVRDTLAVSRCQIATWDKKANTLTIVAEASNAAWGLNAGPDRPLASLLFGTGMLRGGKSLVARTKDAALNPKLREYLILLGMSSVVITPMRLGANAVGVIELYKASDDDPFTQANIKAIEEAISTWETSPRDPTTGISALTAEEFLTLADDLVRVGRAHWCVISLWDSSARRARAVHELGFAVWDEERPASFTLKDHPTMQNSLQHGLPMTLYPSLLRDDPVERALLARSGAQTGLIAPLMARGEVIGVIKLLDTNPERTFDLSEVSLIQGIAGVVANALENARLYRSLERRAADLEAAYEELKVSDRMKDALFQNISHEIKTPLHKMLLQIDLLAQEYLGSVSPEQKQGLAQLTTWGMELAKLVNDMVALHALNIDSMAFVPLEMETLLKHAVERVRYRAMQARVNLYLDVQPNLPTVRGDMQAISDTLDRLIDNAIKFSPDSNQVDISARQNGHGMLEVSVRDYGIGIEAGDLDKIFQRGYQVGGDLLNRPFGGMGLGLSLAKQVVEGHGGIIWAESQQGVGTTFHFTLPTTQETKLQSN